MEKRHKETKVGKKKCSATKNLNCQRMNMSEKALQDYEFANFWRFNGNIIFKDESDGFYDL